MVEGDREIEEEIVWGTDKKREIERKRERERGRERERRREGEKERERGRESERWREREREREREQWRNYRKRNIGQLWKKSVQKLKIGATRVIY